MRSTWRDQALCTEVDPDIFFPDKGAPATDAKSICARCDVRADCLQEALTLGADGIWSGTGPKERRRLRAVA